MSNIGIVNHNGNTYTLDDTGAFMTGRLLPPHQQDYFEMAANGTDAAGNDVLVFWLMEWPADLDAEDRELDMLDYSSDNIDRVEEQS